MLLLLSTWCEFLWQLSFSCCACKLKAVFANSVHFFLFHSKNSSSTKKNNDEKMSEIAVLGGASQLIMALSIKINRNSFDCCMVQTTVFLCVATLYGADHVFSAMFTSVVWMLFEKHNRPRWEENKYSCYFHSLLVIVIPLNSSMSAFICWKVAIGSRVLYIFPSFTHTHNFTRLQSTFHSF